jgi:REP element-mobilizing transposase RayT
MANTYTQLYVQAVFPVKNRACLLNKDIRDQVFSYCSGIIKECEHKPIIVNGYLDHVHIFFGLNPKHSISDLMGTIKANSSKFINDNKLTTGKFEWQKGYGAFSYAKSQIDSVYKYILNQELHHQKRTFKEEYLDFLNKFEVDYDERYLFDWLE